MKKIFTLLLAITSASYFFAQQTYCNPNVAWPAASFHVDQVIFGTINNKSGNNLDGTYSDFTNLSTEVEVGKPINIEVAVYNSYSDTNNSFYDGHLIGWIDYDQSGTFEPSERIFFEEHNLGAKLSTTINIPATAKLGTTRMRIKYRWNFFSDTNNPCELVDLGEAEDYTVKIVDKLGVNDVANTKNKLSVYPNPAKDLLYIADYKEGSYKIYNTVGNIVSQGKNSNGKIDVNKLEKGVYIIEIENQNTKLNTKFIKN